MLSYCENVEYYFIADLPPAIPQRGTKHLDSVTTPNGLDIPSHDLFR